MNHPESDYIIVGAGAAGCVLANRLSADATCRVTLIESGHWPTHPLLSVPALSGMGMAIAGSKTDFLTEPSPQLNQRPLRWTQGHAVGGGSAINGMVYLRGHSDEYDSWSRLGCEGWSFKDVLPFFRCAESHARGETILRGGSGPMPVRRSRPDLPICDAFVAAVAQGGVAIADDLSADARDAVGFFDINAGGGRRVSTAMAYLKPVLARRNLRLLTGTRVLRVVIEAGHAVGVEIGVGDHRQVLRAAREVIVACGAIQSPQLLMLSGIGPASHLHDLGLSVVMDAPEVGKNLRNHPNFQLQYSCNAPVTAYRYMHPLRAAGCMLSYLARRGPLTESFFGAGGYFRTEQTLESPDVYMVTAAALLGHGSMKLRLRDLLPREHGFMISLALGRPRSAGSVRLRSGDPTSPPLIEPNYFSEPDDLRRLARALLMLRDWLKADVFGRFVRSELQPGAAVVDEASAMEAIQARGMSSYHPLGTCRMGGDQQSVVDTKLRVRGVAGLRVADASIMPTALNTPIHAPTIMIAEKASDLIVAG